MKALFNKNPLLFGLGMVNLLLSMLLIILMPFNDIEVLGINSLIKPLKFSLSIFIFSWTMAYIGDYFLDKTYIKRLSILIAVVMIYEQTVITIQAFRGTKSHFNNDTPLEMILFILMGVMITWLTISILSSAIKFKKQQDNLHSTFKSSIYWGLIIFVIASFEGGYMGYLQTHQVGGEMGGEGIPFLNWSKHFGDLRIAHFIGIHALQILPVLGYMMSKEIKSEAQSILILRIIILLYFVLFFTTLIQALAGISIF